MVSCPKSTRKHRAGVPTWILALASLFVAADRQALGEGGAKPTPIFQGIDYLYQCRTEPRPLSFHVVIIDLSAEGISFVVTPGKTPRSGKKDEVTLRRTSTFAKEMKVQVAINGTFFDTEDNRRVEGQDSDINFLAVQDGIVYSPKSENDEVIVRTTGRGGLELWVRPGPAAWTFQPGDGQMALGMARWAQLLRNGEMVASEGEDCHPRTAAGITGDGKKGLLMVVDGRQEDFSEGVTLRELARLLAEFGAANAINLDGGGSSTLVIQQPNGSYRIMNCPSDGYPLSIERPVGTHLGIFAKPLARLNQK